MATTDENLSRVRMDCAHKMRFVPAQVNFMSWRTRHSKISFLFLSSRKSYYVSKLGSLFLTSLYGPKGNEVPEEVFYYVTREQLSFLAYSFYGELVVQKDYNL